MIGTSVGVIAKTQCASWLFVYKYWHTSYRHILCWFYSLFEVKQAQITLNLFRFSRHRVSFIRDERKGGMRSRVVAVIFYFFLFTFTILSDEHLGLSTWHIENNILWFDYNLIVWECTRFSPLYYDPYLDIRVDMATFLHPPLLWSIFRSTVVHITVTGS